MITEKINNNSSFTKLDLQENEVFASMEDVNRDYIDRRTPQFFKQMKKPRENLKWKSEWRAEETPVKMRVERLVEYAKRI